MAENNERMTMTYKAAADLTTKRYHCVRNAADRSCDVSTIAAGGFADGLIGILDNAPNTAEHATVVYGGISKAVAGGAVTQGVIVTTNSVGRVTAAVSGDLAVGQALTAASANGDVITVKVAVWRLSGAV
jgi:hypothetical protein